VCWDKGLAYDGVKEQSDQGAAELCAAGKFAQLMRKYRQNTYSSGKSTRREPTCRQALLVHPFDIKYNPR
jgi:hypothetical protein